MRTHGLATPTSPQLGIALLLEGSPPEEPHDLGRVALHDVEVHEPNHVEDDEPDDVEDEDEPKEVEDEDEPKGLGA